MTPRATTFGFFCYILAACGEVPSTTLTHSPALAGARDDAPAPSEAQEEDRSLFTGPQGDRVDLSGGYHYYELPVDEETPALSRAGAITWRYEGQAIFDQTSDSQEGIVNRWVVPDSIPGPADEDAYYGVGQTRRVDRLGRQWVVDAVDQSAVAAAIDSYDARVLEMFGQPEAPAEHLAPADSERLYFDEAGETQDLLNTSWSRCYCTNEGDYVWWNHSSDSLSKANDPLIARNRKVIWKASGSGSATMVSEDVALTAAHIVTDSSGNAVDVSTVQWCTLENLQENTTGSYEAECFETLWIVPNGTWGGGSDPVRDYAVVGLDTNDAGVGWFAISSASDTYIDDFDDRSAGYPRKLTGNCFTNTDYPVVDSDYSGRHLYKAVGDVQAHPTGYMKYDTSTALGMSGGLHYYCPNTGGCSAGHYLTGVQTNISVNTCSGTYSPLTCWGNSCAGGYSSGPKGSAIRNWVAVYAN